MILTHGGCAMLQCLVMLAALGQAPTPENVPADWRSYTSPDYGFTIQYPKGFTIFERGTDYDKAVGHPMIEVCDGNTVGCFAYSGAEYAGTNFEGAALSVNVVTVARTEKECNEIETGSNPITTKTINGLLFHYGEDGDGVAAGSAKTSLVYRTFYNKVCFELSVNFAIANFENFEAGTIKEFDGAKLLNDFDAMVNTFRFTGPIVGVRAWRVFHNSDVGGSFEYPDGDTVVKSVEYSQARASSNDITDSTYFADHGLNYFVATKVNLKDRNALDSWLKSSGYPTLSEAREFAHSGSYKKYRAGKYCYVYRPNTLYILGASDQRHKVVAPPENVVFRHFVNTFQPN